MLKYGELEAYVCEVSERKVNPNEDVYAQLARKDEELLLAAELGKSLLERNEEISRENERITEQYSQQLEALEQEKHVQRKRWENRAEEYEDQIRELQGDISRMEAELRSTRDALRETEREKSSVILQLREQNDRLASHMQEASRHGENLSRELQSLRDRVSLRRSSSDDHLAQVDLLRSQADEMGRRRREIEEELERVMAERESLRMTLEDTRHQVRLLEKNDRDKEIQMRRAEEEVAEVTARHAAILDRLREGDGKAENSLLNEIHLSFNRDSEKGDLKRRRCDDIEEELEVDEIVPDSSFSDLFGPLKEEVLEVCGQLRALVDHIRQQEKNSLTSLETLSSSSSTSSHSFTHFKVGMLMELVKELRGLILALLRGRGVRSDSLSLEAEVHHLREALEALQIDLQAKLHDIQRQESLVRSLQQQLEICRVKEEGLQEQIQVLQSDLEDTHLSKDQLIRKAWDVRDQAVARKNKAEIELAKARIESLQVNSQLLEAVQQKVELSQQLEQWQVDMQSLLDEQLKEKLRSQELARRKPSTPSVESNQSQGGSTRTARFLRLLRRRSRDDS